LIIAKISSHEFQTIRQVKGLSHQKAVQRYG
jgi:hypothetical protein